MALKNRSCESHVCCFTPYSRSLPPTATAIMATTVEVKVEVVKAGKVVLKVFKVMEEVVKERV